MKNTHRAQLTEAIANLVNKIDDDHPEHELHHETLHIEMANAAIAVYDAAQKAQQFAKSYR